VVGDIDDRIAIVAEPESGIGIRGVGRVTASANLLLMLLCDVGDEERCRSWLKAKTSYCSQRVSVFSS